MKKRKGNTSPYTENWLPIRGIQNGMIITDDKYKITGVKITPRNIFILDQDQQNGVLISLKNFYNMIDFEFWLVVADRPVDISVYMSQLQLLYNKTQSASIRKLILQDINKGSNFINNNVVDTEYYILFKEKKQDIIQKRLHTLISNLANCGLNSQQTSNNDLRVILDNFFNGGSATTFSGMVSP